MMCSLDIDLAPVWRERPHIARRERTCDCCLAPILPGTAYLSVFFVSDGRCADESLCFGCWWGWCEFSDAHRARPCPSAYWEVLENCVVRHSVARAAVGDRWGPTLAGIKARWRTSPLGRVQLRRYWMDRAVRREQKLTRAVRKLRAQRSTS